MHGKKWLLALLLVVAILLSAAGGIGWIFYNNYLIDFQLYPKNATYLDLRGEDVSIRHYNALAKKLPDCRILWDVPFQGGTLPSNTTEITVTTLTDEDVAVLAYLPELDTVHAEDCTDYDSLMLLKEAYPDAAVSYRVTLDGTGYPESAETVELRRISDQELSLLAYLQKLKTVVVRGDTQPQDFSALSR